MNIKPVIIACLLFLATALFYTGFHHIDNAWNLYSDGWDINAKNQVISKIDLYYLGWSQMFQSLAVFFIAVIAGIMEPNKKGGK